MKKWKDASTVIITARNNFPNYKQITPTCDYQILTACRSVESSFMPNSHVFPGGVIDPSDSSAEWEKLHKTLKLSKLQLDDDRVSKLFSEKLEIFHTPKEEHLPRYLSLRIAAIRETFEECGILLCRTSDYANPNYGSFLVTSRIKELQNQLRDRDHPLEFHDVCKSLGCFPDVWSLREARNWLTPAHLPKRFNTAFFMVFLDQAPPTLIDQQEVTDVKWSTPNELLNYHTEGTLWLPPPQLYEISKMVKHQQLESLRQGADKGDFCSELCYFPVIVPVVDGIVFLLPGDSCYDEGSRNPDKFENNTMKSFRSLATLLRRMEHPQDGRGTFVETRDNVTIVSSDLNSKL